MKERWVLWEVGRDAGFEEGDEGRVHVFVVVGDAQGDDALGVELGFEFFAELVPVCIFHDEDELGPLDEVGCERVFGVVVQAGGESLDAGVIGEDLLGGGAAEAVHGADEEDVERVFLWVGGHGESLIAKRCGICERVR